MPVKTYKLEFSTSGDTDILDITSQVSKTVGDSCLENGIVTIFCPSSTSAVTTIEYEPGCLSDIRRLFDEILPASKSYAHNQRWGDGNGHSHARAALLKASLTIPFASKSLALGTWQQIIYVDFDTRPRHRELVVQVMGE